MTKVDEVNHKLHDSIYHQMRDDKDAVKVRNTVHDRLRALGMAPPIQKDMKKQKYLRSTIKN